ncbi:MAG TPA: nuclear transport factor 2 family protein [Bryobacteraceae bacterium]|nr:nuclear transport factor 2 family protein [Bryobacteraceae bacterium]
MSEEAIRTVDAYLNALAAKDISAAPLHPDVTFESPLSPPIRGRDAVRQVFAGFFPSMKAIKVSRHIANSEWCATLLEMETPFGTLPMVDCFHVIDGQIRSIRVYFDPRPIVDGLSQAAPTEPSK